MAEDARSPTGNASGEAAGGATSGAALIATFYVSQRNEERIRALRERFYGRLGPKPRAAQAPSGWSNLDEATGLCFDPPGQAAHDATVVQLGMNAPGGDTAVAWEGLRRKLEGMLDAADLVDIWGYTLVYQAVLKDGFDPDAVLKESLPAVGRLHSEEHMAPIRRAGVPGGWAWLLGIPNRGDGPDAGMVYAALASEEQEKALISQFYSMSGKSVARLMPPDLIAHKGYYQIRQYRSGDLEQDYEKNLADLQETTDRLLEDLQKDGVSSGRLEELFGLYCRLLPVVSALKELQVGVHQQSYNLDGWRSEFWDNEALEFHQRQLDVAVRELDSKVEPLRFSLELADKVVSTARLQMDKKQEEQRRKAEQAEEHERQRWEERRLKEERAEARNQQLIHTLLAVVAAALALPELVDKALAGWLIGRIPVLDSFEGNIFAEFVAQVVLIAILAVPIWLGVRRWLEKPPEGRVSGDAERRISEDG